MKSFALFFVGLSFTIVGVFMLFTYKPPAPIEIEFQVVGSETKATWTGKRCVQKQHTEPGYYKLVLTCK